MLGPRLEQGGVRFTVQAPRAEGMDLCLFDRPEAGSETRRIPFRRTSDGIWQVFVPDAGPGTVYGLRARGPWDPVQGLRFHPSKLLLDPAAPQIYRAPHWHEALHDCDLHNPGWVRNDRDSSPWAARGMVIDSAFAWEMDRKPAIPWSETVIYEAHVKGLTFLNPHVPESERGTYRGLAHPSVIEYLRELGVTTLELLPVHAHIDDHFLVEKGLTNYWGYSTLSWWAPHPGYASEPERAVQEFQSMVKALHRGGIEVVLDVVYNHTCEGSERGSSISWRGLDDAGMYRRHKDGTSEDFTGCGNTVDFRDPGARAMVLDSLRWWADTMHVDGFRFDLASVHGRLDGGFDGQAPFFQEMAKDPVLSSLKNIAEPWDASWGGYGLGKFPPGWTEWNDRFRDGLRRYWRGDGDAKEAVLRLSGSPDLFSAQGRGALASINFVACHDGFCLNDLVSFRTKHNEGNLEDNRDGSDHEVSDNCGVEGPSQDPLVIKRRQQRMRNLLSSVLLADGIPMLLAGDERGRTQMGNNNAYCQDSPVSWVQWDALDSNAITPAWVRGVLRLRKEKLRGGTWELFSQGNSNALVLQRLSQDGHRIVWLSNPSENAIGVDVPTSSVGWLVRLNTQQPALHSPLFHPGGRVELDPGVVWILEEVQQGGS